MEILRYLQLAIGKLYTKIRSLLEHSGTHPVLFMCFSGGVVFEYHRHQALFTHISTMQSVRHLNGSVHSSG